MESRSWIGSGNCPEFRSTIALVKISLTLETIDHQMLRFGSMVTNSDLHRTQNIAVFSEAEQCGQQSVISPVAWQAIRLEAIAYNCCSETGTWSQSVNHVYRHSLESSPPDLQSLVTPLASKHNHGNRHIDLKVGASVCGVCSNMILPSSWRVRKGRVGKSS